MKEFFPFGSVAAYTAESDVFYGGNGNIIDDVFPRGLGSSMRGREGSSTVDTGFIPMKDSNLNIPWYTPPIRHND